MNKILLLTLVAATLFCFSNIVNAQNDSSQLHSGDTAQAQINGSNDFSDDDFSPGMFFIVLIVGGIIAGAAIVGCLAALVLIAFLGILVSTGIFSASVLTGFYKKSAAAGFKTFIILICTFGGMILGSVGLLIIKKIFSLHLSGKSAFLLGAGGGLVGGLLMGWLIYKMVIVAFSYFKKKFQLS